MINHARLSKPKYDQTYNVALAQGEDRYHCVFNALTSLTTEINPQINLLKEEDDYILVKPNCVVSRRPNCATHPEALRALLDYLAPMWNGKIIIAEGSAENTVDAFDNYGYTDLKQDYPNIEFLDLNYSDAIFVEICDKDLKPMTIKISNTLAEAPYRISIGPPKTHDSVIVTLSIKNMAVGSILKEDKSKIHQSFKSINHSIAKLFEYTHPHLSVIDGWQSMEGNGPINGKMVDTKYAATSTNPLAADTFVTELMGFNPVQVGYLNLLGAEKIMSQIQPIGLDPKILARHLKPHRTYLKQIDWA